MKVHSMKINSKLLSALGSFAMCAGIVALSSCGGSGNAGTPSPEPTPAASYQVGGAVKGLFTSKSAITLKDNGSDATTVTGNGNFVFAKKVTGGNAYDVTVASAPTNPPQNCTVSGGSGTAVGNVSSIVVDCAAPAAYTVGGTVTGLAVGSGGLVLADNGGDSLAVSTDGSFTFSASITASEDFNVTVASQPSRPMQTCAVSGGSGTVSANVSMVMVSCAAPATFTIGGMIENLTGTSSGLILQDNAADNFTVTADGNFAFATGVQGGEPYSVSIAQQPFSPVQTCSVVNGSGTAKANVTNVVIDCGHKEWTWMNGTSTTGQAGVYGTMGVAAAANLPGGRQNPVTWTDLFGNFWMFGGYGYDSRGSVGLLNDLWRYSDGKWAWMGGSNLAGASPAYGAMGEATASNVPGARHFAASWSDGQGNLWIFGGDGIDSTGAEKSLSDLWKYSNGEWTWLNGPNVGDEIGDNGGGIGVVAASNVPSARTSATSWIDSAGNLWLFGGTGDDGFGQFQQNDLWEYSNGNWVWAGGTNLSNKSGVYGTQGVAGAANIPGGRSNGSGWVDESGAFWLFGGVGYDANGANSQLNDLWKYSNGEWTWVSGSSTAEQLSAYGTMGVAAATNVPSARMNSVVWKDRTGSFWMLGGFGVATDGSLEYLNDLWEYSNGEWIWAGGMQTANAFGIYGTEGVPAPGNMPGARQNAGAWVDVNGNLWMFSGFGYAAAGSYDQLTDMWEYRF